MTRRMLLVVALVALPLACGDSAAKPDMGGDGPRSDSAIDGPRPDGPSGDTTRDGPQPDGPRADTSVDGPQPDGPQPDGPRADTSVDSSTGDSTVDSASPDTTVDVALSDTHGGPFAGQTIPDPGNGTADWVNTIYEDHETPSKAWKVGLVTQNNPYLTMDMHPSGYAYLVFRTGPSFTRFDVDVGGSSNTVGVNFVHLHDGAGLKLGNAVTPIYSTNTTGGWNVQPNHVYVLEISSAGAGFV